MPPLGMHAYRLFSNENRQEVQSALKFDGKPAAMSDVAKVLGQKWRELSDESKKVYLDQAGAAAAAAAAAAPAAGAEGDTDTAPAENTEREAGGLALPLARVKKVIRLDGDVKQVSADAARLIAHATELFVASLAAGSHAVAATGKRRTVRFADVEHMPAMRPKAVVKPKPVKAGVAPAAEEGGVEGAAGAAGGEPGIAAAKPTRAITSFFAAAPSKAAAPQGGEDEEAEEEGGDEDMDEEDAADDDVVVDVQLVDEE